MSKPTPWREHGSRYIATAVGFLIGVGLIVVVGGKNLWSLLPWWALLIVLIVGLALLLGATTIGLLIGQRLVGNKLELAVRAGGGKWRHGRAELQGSRLTFWPYYWQIRVPKGDREELLITGLDQTHSRRPALRELIALNPQARVVRAETASGPIEIAALPSRLHSMASTIATSAT